MSKASANDNTSAISTSLKRSKLQHLVKNTPECYTAAIARP